MRQPVVFLAALGIAMGGTLGVTAANKTKIHTLHKRAIRVQGLTACDNFFLAA